MWIAFDKNVGFQVFKSKPTLVNGRYEGTTIGFTPDSIFGSTGVGCCELANIEGVVKPLSWDTRQQVPDCVVVTGSNYEVDSIHKYGVELKGYGSMTWKNLAFCCDPAGKPCGVE